MSDLNILEALKTTSNKTKDYANKSYANALIGEASGQVVTLDDVSPLDHKVSVKVNRKNLIPFPYPFGAQYTIEGITAIVVKDGSIILNGTSTSASVSDITILNDTKFPAGTYSLSGCPASGGTYTYRFMWHIKKANGENLYGNDVGTGSTLSIGEGDTVKIVLRFGKDLGMVENLTFYPQLELGAVATPYAPYVPDDTKINVKSCGKNLIAYPYIYHSDVYEERGVTFKVNGDGSITLNGTATGDHAQYRLWHTSQSPRLFLPAGTYVVPRFPEGIEFSVVLSENSEYPKDGNEDYMNIWQWANGSFGTLEKGYYIAFISLIALTGKTFDNFTFYPQLEVGNKPTAHEPYKEGETIEATFDEDVELNNIAPNMTITTDTDGVIIEATYNKDFNGVIEKLTQAIISLGGTV